MVLKDSDRTRGNGFISPREGFVFVVDDNPVFAMMVEEELKNILPQVSIITFSTGEECLNNIYLAPFLIVLDYDLSSGNKDGINGIKVLREIKKKLPATEVLMLSGFSDLKIVVRSVQCGAFDYVLKGECTLGNMRSKIGHVLRKLRKNEAFGGSKELKWFLKWLSISLLLFETGI
jgi:DNA-binding NarL/FixJ family response regulator